MLCVSCGAMRVTLEDNPDATYGQVTPQISISADVNPDDTIVDEVAEVVNPAIEAFTETAPPNPTNVLGWLYAAAAAVLAGGAVAAKKYLFKKKLG